MNTIHGIIGGMFDLALSPFAASPAWGMVVVSVFSAVWALLLFRLVTPQRRLAAARERLLGHILEMGLYQDQLRVVGRIQRDLAVANLRYLATSLPALVVLLIPMVLTLGQLDARFSHRPVGVGETTVLAVMLSPEAAAHLDGLRLAAPIGVTVEAGPVRDRIAGAAAWRVRADAPGRHVLTIKLDGREVATRDLVAGDGLPRLGETAGTGWLGSLLHPGVRSHPRGGPVLETRMRFPARSVRYFGIELDWLIAFMLISMAGGFALKDLMGVEI